MTATTTTTAPCDCGACLYRADMLAQHPDDRPASLPACTGATGASWPVLTPSPAGESAHEYGYRALLFAVQHGPEWVTDTRALQLADHVFPAAISGPEISPRALEILAAVRCRITAVLRRRALETAAAPASLPAAAGEDRPAAGPMAPLDPPPAPKAPPAGKVAVRGVQPPRRGVQAPPPPVRPVPVPLLADPF